MELTESRFAHLLQPIKELTRNWEIDVASELNDYLEELDEMCITFDGGKNNLNFAEAALLIQGSTCIYSKKVELLHNLVYQTLEYLSDRSKKRNNRAAAQEDNTGETQGSHNSDDVAEFTFLNLEASENSQQCDSNSTVNVVPLPPASLIPPEIHEKQKLPLISVKGEVVCSQRDFRINMVIPGEENMILLRLAAATRSLDRLPAELEVQQQAVGVESISADEAAENFLPLEDQIELDQNPEEHIERHQVSVPSDGRKIRDTRRAEADKSRRHGEAPPAENIWELHDPYTILGEEEPFKAGKCYKVPYGLDDEGKRKRKQATPLQDFRSWFSETFDPPEPKLKNGPTFTDLNYIYLSTLKDRVKRQRKLYRKVGMVMSEHELTRNFLQLEEMGPGQQEAEPLDEFQHADLFDGDEDDLLNMKDAEDDAPGDPAGPPASISPETLGDELTFEDLAKLRVEQLVASSQGYVQELALSRRVKDWEDRIRPKLAQQENQPPFDIHDYCERIVGALGRVGHRMSFASIIHGLDNVEVSKYLVASLQLANDYTVEIHSTAGLEDSLDSMLLTLISTDKATDRFKTLTASTSTHQ